MLTEMAQKTADTVWPAMNSTDREPYHEEARRIRSEIREKGHTPFYRGKQLPTRIRNLYFMNER